jgi:KipI family sensor histidine kinase inhibitor
MAGQFNIVPERPLIQALGDSAILVRFGSSLDERANRRTIGFAASLAHDPVPGIVEVAPSLVSVLLRFDPRTAVVRDIEGEVRLRLFRETPDPEGSEHRISVNFGGEDGPDLDEVAGLLQLSPGEFIERHNGQPLRVLATGFSPGFVYCGFHPEELVLARRSVVRAMVPAGSVLFAAGQTAIAATDIPTGWHVIGRTAFSNFDPAATPPTVLRAGDTIMFEAVA